MWIVIGVLFLVILFLTYKTSSLTGNAVAGNSGKLDTTGWTDNEKMNYEMHGTIPARLRKSKRVKRNRNGRRLLNQYFIFIFYFSHSQNGKKNQKNKPGKNR